MRSLFFEAQCVSGEFVHILQVLHMHSLGGAFAQRVRDGELIE